MAHKFQPRAKLEAYHANIKDSQFNVDWFGGFDVAFNALDNLDARRYVNRMCLAAGVPLIESGTTGFNGQVQVIKKVGIMRCDAMRGDCAVWLIIYRAKLNATIAIPRKSRSRSPSVLSGAHPVSRSTALSGLRATFSRMCSTPSLHDQEILILFSELFGRSEDETEELDSSEDAENGRLSPASKAPRFTDNE